MPRDDVDLSGILIDSRFRGECCIGRGGMGAVWRVRHVHTLQYFALKTIRSDDPLDGVRLKRFLQEARVAAAIRSEHVVRVFDVRPDYIHEGKPLPYLIMELVDGGSLQDLLDTRGRLTPGEVVWILRQVVTGLTCIHTRGVVHRDLKPSNVLLAKHVEHEWCVKLCDLGIAKCQPASGNSERDLATFSTDSECLLGTPRYMAPEQLHQTTSISSATDQWPMALIAFRALTGRDYFQDARNGLRLALAIVNESLPPPSTLSPMLPTGFDAWFLRSCSRDPKGRFANVQRQLEALERALQWPKAIPPRLDDERVSTDAPVAALPRPTRRRETQALRWGLVGVSAVLSLLASTWLGRQYASGALVKTYHAPPSKTQLAWVPSAVGTQGSTSSSPLSNLTSPLPLSSPLSDLTSPLPSSSPMAEPFTHPAVSASPRPATTPQRRPLQRSRSEHTNAGARLPQGAHCVRSSQCVSGVCLAEACR